MAEEKMLLERPQKWPGAMGAMASGHVYFRKINMKINENDN